MATLAHLEEYANDGLRTLCLSYKILDPYTFNEWCVFILDLQVWDISLIICRYKTYQEASVSLQDREQKLMDVAEVIEKDLILLGATALEDKLQVGVPDAIFALGKAGLKVSFFHY